MNFENQTGSNLPDTGQGYLIVHVTTARGSIPLEGAQVNIRRSDTEDTTGRGDVILGVLTDRDGNTPRITLAAPPRASSQAPSSNGIRPYSSYHAEVMLEGYFTQNYINIPIFDGITAIQPADMIPLSENQATDSRTPDGERFFESSAPNL